MIAYLTAHWPLAIFAGGYVLAAVVLTHELLIAVAMLDDEGDE